MRVMVSSFLRFLDHTQRRTTVGRTTLDLYLTTHNTHNRQHIHAPGGIRTHDLSKRAAADLRLRPRGYWDRQFCISLLPFIGSFGDLVRDVVRMHTGVEVRDMYLGRQIKSAYNL